jgi:hypothetical protein
MCSCEEQVSFFYDVINNLLDTHMPMKLTKKCPTDKPWITPHFKDLLKKRQKAFASGNEEQYRHFRNKANRVNKNLKSYFYKSKIEDLKSNDSKKWWNGVKQITGSASSSRDSLAGLTNELCGGDTKMLADKINKFFQSVSCDLPKPDKSQLDPVDPNFQVPDKYIISLTEVEKQLMQLNVRKAPGPDNLPNWILHDFPGVLAPPICAIFNSSIREGKLPQLWKSATACPIPKKNPPKALETDLRPISLTCILSKELETSVVKWLWDIVLPLMDPYQYGAMAKCSTVHALVEILHNWFSATDNSRDRNFIHTVLIDYSKAFDRIDPVILLGKLKALNVPNFLLHWIADFLSDRSQRVRVNDCLSEVLQIWGTVPQGTKLGILLFLIMINDLVTRIPTFKYVDDTTLYSVGKNPECPLLQEAVNEVVSWSNQNHMKINASKTKEMLVCFNHTHPMLEPITVNGVQLERVDSVTLLGLRISEDLSWGTHVNYIIKKAQSCMFTLNLLRRSRVSGKDIIMIFTTKIRPILEYAAAVWHPGLTCEQTEALENIQKRAMKLAFPNLEYKVALETCKVPSLEERRIYICKKLFERMQVSTDKLNRILPARQDNVKNTRNAKMFPLPKTHTSRYKKSFLPYALYNFQ